MPCPGTGPCEVWDLDLSSCLVSGSVPDVCLVQGQEVSQAAIDSAILAASQTLWVLTGRQFGTCTVTIRPCRLCKNECCIPEYGPDYLTGHPWYPLLYNGIWTNISCLCENECSCTRLSEVLLPSPVRSVDEVVVDGATLDPSAYRVDEFRKLVRIGGEWPRCNDLTKEDTEDGTWSVTVTYGRPVPELVLKAAEEFACELIKAAAGQNCKLPQRLQSVTRQGVTVSFLDSFDMLGGGMTGLYLVDLAITTYNPRRLSSRPSVWSPDAGPNWRRAGT